MSHLSRPEATSVTFDRTGSLVCLCAYDHTSHRLEGWKLAVTFLNFFPTIYSLGDPAPLAICSGRRRPGGDDIPSGERTYVNTCTMKVGPKALALYFIIDGTYVARLFWWARP